MYSNRWINDRRKYQRLSVNISLSYTVENPLEVSTRYQGKDIEATMLNISEAGLSLASMYNIPAWSTIIARFNLFKTDKQGFIIFSNPIQLICEVRYSVAMEDGKYRMGASFRGVKDTAKSEITSFLESALHM